MRRFAIVRRASVAYRHAQKPYRTVDLDDFAIYGLVSYLIAFAIIAIAMALVAYRNRDR
jgi:hypothetical protein